MGKKEEIRKVVTKAYTQAVTGQKKSCCTPGPDQKGVTAKLAGYSPEELETLPPDAVINSFGCGDPLAFSQVREGETVLDLGCGAGIDILLAGRKVGPTGRVIGIDMNDAMLAEARKNIAAAGMSHVEVRRGIIEELPVDSSTVDWVISNCVINLSPDKPRVFAEIARILRPGGRMSISDVVVRDLPDWIRRGETLYTACVAGAISEEEYVEGLGGAGLEDVQVRDRLLYDLPQLRSILEAEVLPGIGPEAAGGRNVEEAAESLVGKIWSAKFYARKPPG